MVTYYHQENALVADYGPAFLEAAGLVETACAGFVAPAHRERDLVVRDEGPERPRVAFLKSDKWEFQRVWDI